MQSLCGQGRSTSAGSVRAIGTTAGCLCGFWVGRHASRQRAHDIYMVVFNHSRPNEWFHDRSSSTSNACPRAATPVYLRRPALYMSHGRARSRVYGWACGPADSRVTVPAGIGLLTVSYELACRFANGLCFRTCSGSEFP